MFITKKYKDSPLVEAICEFHFIPQEGVANFDYVDKYYESINEEFPTKNIREKIGIQFGGEDGNLAIPSISKGIEVFQFKSHDNSTIIQLGENLIAVNHLKVYTTWEIFKPIIKKNVEKFLELRDIQVFNSANIRYINKIDLERTERFTLSDYFNFDLKIPQALSQEISSLNLRTDLWYENSSDLCTIVLRSAPQSVAEEYSFYFDITYAAHMQIAKADITSWLERAHKNLNAVFENCLTDFCKEKFN